MKKTLKLIAVSIVAISANTAMAESGKWYVGVGAGQTKYNDWASKSDITNSMDEFGSRLGVDDFDGSVDASADDSDSGYKLFGGYWFNKYIGAEFSYIDLGEVNAESRASGTFYDIVDNSLDGDVFAAASAEVKAFTLDANLRYPIGSMVELFVKGGIYSADTDLNVSAGGSISGQTYSYSESEDSTGLHYGLGATLKITEAIGVRAEWERLDGIEANNGESNVDLMSASLVYSF